MGDVEEAIQDVLFTDKTVYKAAEYLHYHGLKYLANYSKVMQDSRGVATCRKALITAAQFQHLPLLHNYFAVMDINPEISTFFEANCVKDLETFVTCCETSRYIRKAMVTRLRFSKTMRNLLVYKFDNIGERNSFVNLLLLAGPSERRLTAEIMLLFPTLTVKAKYGLMSHMLLDTAAQIISDAYNKVQNGNATISRIIVGAYRFIVTSNLKQIHAIPGMLFQYTITLQKYIGPLATRLDESVPIVQRRVISFFDDAYQLMTIGTEMPTLRPTDWLLELCSIWKTSFFTRVGHKQGELKPTLYSRIFAHNSNAIESKVANLQQTIDDAPDIDREYIVKFLREYYSGSMQRDAPMDVEESRDVEELDGLVESIMQETAFLKDMDEHMDELSEDVECIELQQKFNQEPVPEAKEISAFMSDLFTENEQTSPDDDVYLGDQAIKDIAGLVQAVDEEMDDIEYYAMEEVYGPFVPLPLS